MLGARAVLSFKRHSWGKRLIIEIETLLIVAHSCDHWRMDEDEQRGSDSPGRLVMTVIGVVFVAIALVILAAIGLVASLVVWAISEVVTDHDNAFRVIGENAGPFGAWAAAIVGITTVAVLAKTNRTRAREIGSERLPRVHAMGSREPQPGR